jgi:hypothetical protein
MEAKAMTETERRKRLAGKVEALLDVNVCIDFTRHRIETERHTLESQCNAKAALISEVLALEEAG